MIHLLDLFKKRKDKEFIIDDTDKNTLFEHTETKIWKIANFFIVILIILSIVLVMFESMWNNGKEFLYQIFIADLIISSLFWIEYIYRYIRSDKKSSFFYRPMNILDLLSFLPFFIITIIFWIGNYAILAIFRIFRLFKIFELFQRIPILVKLFRWINSHKVEYTAWIVIIWIILISFSTIIYFFESTFSWNTDFTSIPSTIWWAVVTMTTVWYWDMIPHSLWGKIFGWFLMFLWPIVIAILSSLTVLIFLESTKMIQYKKRDTSCNSCWANNLKDNNYCRHCWEKM